jgi:hypothetical protein
MFCLTMTKQLMSYDRPDLYRFSLEETFTALSRIVRYNGHINISVLEHSWNMYREACAANETLAVRLMCLFHDAPEAFTGDITNPMQEYLGQLVRDAIFTLQRNILNEMLNQLGLDTIEYKSIFVMGRVKHYDQRALWNETYCEPQLYPPVPVKAYIATVNELVSVLNDATVDKGTKFPANGYTNWS